MLGRATLLRGYIKSSSTARLRPSPAIQSVTYDGFQLPPRPPGQPCLSAQSVSVYHLSL